MSVLFMIGYTCIDLCVCDYMRITIFFFGWRNIFTLIQQCFKHFFMSLSTSNSNTKSLFYQCIFANNIQTTKTIHLAKSVVQNQQHC